ncbi:glycosyltransferase family 4 protein [Pseudomonas sp. fls2-241-R2A-110]|jgi:Fuc2NAc and GlcNAc transferase|uniref:MraY family glycosyltransferase n=1 Tax=Pseudomonas sp. fls2-241-R2A-110 TaxID=3040311 RepID=UPI002555ACB4|nr:glycosyltransferase family 4 protein [Pseudomonas sp. fls2-241-R2A-110]
MTFLWLLLAVFVVSWGLTLVLRRYALANSLMDTPNERSSHSVPTPRGGGVAIVVSFLLALLILRGLDLMSLATLVGLLGSGLLVALIGFADDHGHIAARWRLLGHFAASIWALYWLGGSPGVTVFGLTLDPGWIGNILFVLYLVWMLNLYNFMDGIDGLASAEAISVCLGMLLVYWFSANLELAWGPLALVAAVAGFLCWNYPPAKIFMGDAGSGFLGIVLAGMSIEAASRSPELLWSWLIMLGVFIVDATWTLMRRLLRGEKVYEAHRSHGYQYASRKHRSHKTVTLASIAINFVWLMPLSIAVASGWIPGFFGMVVAYAPLLFIARTYKAGEPEQVV